MQLLSHTRSSGPLMRMLVKEVGVIRPPFTDTAAFLLSAKVTDA